MEITLEQVERLREKADVSYGQAKAALEYSGGNLLDALIYLEEQGVIPRPEDAYYSTKNETPPPPPQELPVLQVKPEAKQPSRKSTSAGACAICSTGCGASCWTMSWRSGARGSPSPPSPC